MLSAVYAYRIHQHVRFGVGFRLTDPRLRRRRASALARNVDASGYCRLGGVAHAT
jgi:hypothetical protein